MQYRLLGECKAHDPGNIRLESVTLEVLCELLGIGDARGSEEDAGSPIRWMAQQRSTKRLKKITNHV